MVPSSLCQLPRCSALCSSTRSLNAARRPVSFAVRAAHTPSFSSEKRLRRVVTFAKPDDQTSSVAEKKTDKADAPEPTPPFKAKDVTEADWEEEVLKSDVPVFVDFWAPWCGPCRMIGPTIDEIIDELGDKFKAVKLNTDKSPSVATEYGIRSIPTCMIFKGGKKVDTIIGAVKKPVLKSSIEKYLP